MFCGWMPPGSKLRPSVAASGASGNSSASPWQSMTNSCRSYFSTSVVGSTAFRYGMSSQKSSPVFARMSFRPSLSSVRKGLMWSRYAATCRSQSVGSSHSVGKGRGTAPNVTPWRRLFIFIKVRDYQVSIMGAGVMTWTSVQVVLPLSSGEHWCSVENVACQMIPSFPVIRIVRSPSYWTTGRFHSPPPPESR